MTIRWYAVAACIAALALVMSACSSGSAKVSSGTVPTATSTTVAASGPELRGVTVTAFACPRNFGEPSGNAQPVGTIEELAVCASAIEPVSPVVVHAGDAGFSTLIRALAEPSQTVSHGVCPAYADAPFVVLAKTDRGVFSIPIPTDSCRHYLRDASVALNQLRGGPARVAVPQ